MEVDKDKLIEAFKRELDLPVINDKIARLKQLFATKSFNPFNGVVIDEANGWDNMKEANRLIADLIDFAITTAERISADAGAALSGKDKLDAVVKFLDDAIKVPWYLEAFDGPAIRLAITQVVNVLNAKVGHDWAQRLRPAGSL
jgi:hypothetical protein